MRCADVLDYMDTFVTGRLGSAQARAVAHHLAACAACRDWREEVRTLAALWEGGPIVAGLDLAKPVLARLAGARRPLAVPGGWTALFHYALAASLTVALFHLGVFQHLGSLTTRSAALSLHVQGLARALAHF